MFTVERYHDFCAGHRVYGHENKCRNLHGHNYRITFVCASTESHPSFKSTAGKPLDNIGRVIDFSVVKEWLCEWLEREWDHKFLLWEKDPIAGDSERSGIRSWDFESFVFVPFNPTAENMAQYLVEVVGPEQLRGTGVVLIECRVEETRKCTATYRKEGW